MKRVLIHIGNLKTGTTAIQSVLRRLRTDLAERGFVMPALGEREQAHYALAKEFGRPADKAHRREQILAEVAAAPDGSTVILTAETLMYVEPEWLRDRMAECGCGEVRIVVYLRPHASMLGSYYLQNLKHAIIRGPMASHLTLLRLAPMQFLAVVAAYGAVFGREAMIVREFNRSALADGSVVADFWDRTGMPADLRAKAVGLESVNNPTPTTELALLLRASAQSVLNSVPAAKRRRLEEDQNSDNLMRRTNDILFRTLSDQAAELPGSRFRMPVQLHEALNQCFEKERAAFAATWFDTPPTASWLHEAIEAPEPLVDLPYGPIEKALMVAERRMTRKGDVQVVRALKRFSDALPITETPEGRLVQTARLTETFGLAEVEMPAVDDLLPLMTAKKASARKRGRG